MVLSLAVGYLILPDVLRRIENYKFGGGVSDSGEGRWTVNAMWDLGHPPCYYYRTL